MTDEQEQQEQQDPEQPKPKQGKTFLERNGGVPLDHPRRCQAQRSNGRGPCRRFAIRGGIVCRVHGGAAEQVQLAATVRLKLAADRMARNLLGLAEEARSEHVQYLATTAALDRAGVVQPTNVNVNVGQAPYEQVFEGIAPITRAESRAARGLPPPPALSTGDRGDDIVDAEVVDDSPSGPNAARSPDDRGDVPGAPLAPGTSLQTVDDAIADLRRNQRAR